MLCEFVQLFFNFCGLHSFELSVDIFDYLDTLVALEKRSKIYWHDL